MGRSKEGKLLHLGSSVLLDQFPVVVDRLLARLIGLNHAIVLQQVHYWLYVNKLAGRNYVDGRYWTYNSQESWWKTQFQGLWSIDTQRTIFSELEEAGFLLVANHNKLAFDRTRWYSIDYDKLDTFVRTSSADGTQAGSLGARRSGKVLFDQYPIVVKREAVHAFGLKAAIILQQIHYWIDLNAKAGRNYHDGRYWTYNTINKWWKDEFHILGSKPTVRRAFKTLETAGVLLVGNYNKNKFDQTRWYSIDYNQLEYIVGGTSESDQLDVIKIPKSTGSNSPERQDHVPHLDPVKNDQIESITASKPIPETTHRITNTDIPNPTEAPDDLLGFGSVRKGFEVLDRDGNEGEQSITRHPLPHRAFTDPRFLEYIETMEAVLSKPFTDEEKLEMADQWMREVETMNSDTNLDGFHRYKKMTCYTIGRQLNAAEEKHLERLWEQYDEDLLMKADQELFGQLQVQSITNPIAYIQKILENWMKNGVIMTDITKRLSK